MLPQDVWLHTEWLSCRRNSVLRCVERYSAAAASEYRRSVGHLFPAAEQAVLEEGAR